MASQIWLDLRHGCRAWLRSPLVFVVGVLSIGLGIGAATAAYSWMDALVLHPFPAVADADRLVGLEVGAPSGGMGAWSYQTFKELRDGTRSFSGMAAWRIVRVSAREPGEGSSAPLLATTVSGRYFDVLGVTPGLGRGIGDADVDAAAPVAVLGYQYWVDRYRRDAGVLGRVILLNGQPMTVVGIAPPGFSGVYTGVVPQLYVPMTLQPRLSLVNALEDRKLRTWLVFARLAPGASLESARLDADAVARHIGLSYGDRPAPGADVMFLRVQFLGATLSPLLTAIFAVTLVLAAVATANVTGLLLVRAETRQAETILRCALGATTWRVMRIAFLESVLLASAGTVVAVAGVFFARGALYSLVPRGAFPLSLPVPIGWRVLGVALASAISVTVASSVAPAAAAARIATRVAWPGSTRGLTVGRTGIRSAIAAGQVALCILALVLTGMFARGLSRVASVDVGFSDPEHVLLVDTDFGAARLTDAAGTSALERLVTQLRAIPGVQSATVASMVPLGFGGRRIVEARVAGYAPAPNENMSVERAHVGAKYATTMKIAVVEGRDILDEDRAATTPVALVNQAFVTRFLPGRPAIGNQVDVAGGWATIVGVLHDGKYDRLDEPLHPVVYVPYAQWFLPSMTIHVRTTEDPRAVADPVRQALLSINMDLPALQTRTLAEHISASTFVPRTGTRVLSAVSAAAIGLAIVGLYGSLSFAVAVRAREFGIRLALGAGARRIARDVFTQALVVVGAGVAVGSGLGLFAGQILKAHVSSVGSVDPLLWIGSVLLLCVAAAIAAFGPARRAVRIDPATSVRGD